MRLLTLFLLPFLSLQCLALLDLIKAGHHKLDAKLEKLEQNIARDCPDYVVEKSVSYPRNAGKLNLWNIVSKMTRMHKLSRQLSECRHQMTQKYPANATSVNSNFSSCHESPGSNEVLVQLVSYSNPTNKRGIGAPCDHDRSPCEIFMEICISPLNSSSCEFCHALTDVVGDTPTINLPKDLGNITNPLKITFGNRKWQGAHILVTVLDKDDENNLRDYHEVDEFSYELTDVQGSHRLITLYGQRATDKTELKLMFTLPCPSLSTTLPTEAPATTTARVSTTTVSQSPEPTECYGATNLTQSWRLEHNGQDIRGGGPQADGDGYACDMYRDIGWFRLTGAAGSRMLDTCPKYLSCGTKSPLWTDGSHPQAVGVITTIPVYGVEYQQCKYYYDTIKVMRCSRNKDDFIYRYTSSVPSSTGVCSAAYCGMN